jgi:magnesium-transporting ATPase (P-type)
MTKAEEKSIILMAKLASYEKEHGEKDRKMAEFFRHDYVYRRNVATRFFTLLGSFIVALFYFMRRIIIERLDILDLTGEVVNDLIKTAIFIVLMQVAYTLIGFWAHAREYNAAQGRINEYFENIDTLSRMKEMNEAKNTKSKADARGRAGEVAARRYEPDDGYDFTD